MIPSVFFAYTLFEEKKTNQKINLFIENEFTNKGHTIVYKKIKLGTNTKNIKLAFLRHATSKIYELDDLWNINTLGFRGEALPSIASVAKVECLTSDGKDSTLVYLEEGKIIKETKGELRRGTKIVIDSLFYNTPARLKHLKSSHRGIADVVNYVIQMALAYPSVKWELLNDEKVLLKTDGTDNLLKVINDVYGVTTARKMLPFNAEDDDYEVTGPELDTMVDEARKIDGVIGSRMTGGGFGGCTVSLVKDEAVDTFISQVGKNYQEKTGLKPVFYVAEIGDGGKKLF